MVGQAAIPAGSRRYILGVIGGVGGSVTLLSYGYWIREKGWEGRARLGTVRLDLVVAYVLTGLFGIAVMVLAAETLYGGSGEIRGPGGVIEMASMLGRLAGPAGHWTFLVGFWGAVGTSMLGVWQGVPYLFCDFVGLMRKLGPAEQRAIVDTRSASYRLFLLWLSVPPISLLFFDRPIAVIVIYSVMSALFMPFVAGTLLWLNSRRAYVGDSRNGWAATAALLLCVALFLFLAIDTLRDL